MLCNNNNNNNNNILARDQTSAFTLIYSNLHFASYTSLPKQKANKMNKKCNLSTPALSNISNVCPELINVT